MKNKVKSLAILLICLLSIEYSYGQQGAVQSQNVKNDAKMTWWKEAKFGMFIHWGIYSVPAGKWGTRTDHGEWIMNGGKIPRAIYEQFAPQFNPTKYNPEEWVKLALASGQKYMVITSKHHDGFAMFDTKVTDYNIMDRTPYGKDVIRQLVDACRKYGMKIGLYYSQAQDWYHPGGAVSGGDWDSTHLGDYDKYMDQISIPQVKELLTNYKPDIIWWDTPTNMSKERIARFEELVKEYPNMITNNRLGEGTGDLETPEQRIPATGIPGKNWEVCMTMNGHWGYNAWDDNWKTTTELLQKLSDIVSKGGNLLLNVGPDQTGTIPLVCQKELREIGDWMKINGEAIYGTTASPFAYLPFGRATEKGQTLYLHVFNWARTISLPFTNKVLKAYLLADPTNPLKYTIKDGLLTIKLPAYAPDKAVSIIAVKHEGKIPVQIVPTKGKELRIVSGGSTDNEMVKVLTDSSERTKWAAKSSDATIEIDLGKPVFVQCISLAEPWNIWDAISQKWQLDKFENSKWVKVSEGLTGGVGITQGFTPQKAQRFRLTISNAKQNPSLGEIELYE